jgi:alpha-L-fucosidase
VAQARSRQPHLIVVDRTVGKFEDYRTPEQEVPEKPLPYHWETCMTMGDQWSYKPEDKYKSTRQLIQLLVGIVAKGGNFLLNVGPRPDGTLPPEAVARLEEIGRWMDVNAEAIHGTRPVAPYQVGQIALTRKGSILYATYLASTEESAPPAQLRLPFLHAKPGAQVRLLGCPGVCPWQADGAGLRIDVPAAARQQPPSAHAWAFRLEGAEILTRD